MVRGRKARQQSTMIADKTSTETICSTVVKGNLVKKIDEQYYSSPKRKEIKLNEKFLLENNNNVEKNNMQLNDRQMSLRNGTLRSRNYTSNTTNKRITQYFSHVNDELLTASSSQTSTPSLLSLASLADHNKLKLNSIIDLTKESYDSFMQQNSQEIFKMDGNTNILKKEQLIHEVDEDDDVLMVKIAPKEEKNIFLQEPVLKLHIDNDLLESDKNKIIIKNSLDVKPPCFTLVKNIKNENNDYCINNLLLLATATTVVTSLSPVSSFSSSSSSSSSSTSSRSNSTDDHLLLNNNDENNKEFNNILDLSKPTQVTKIDSTNNLIYTNDNSNNSWDSGVVTDNYTQQQQQREENMVRRRKPSTPHRIVCPSPVKQQHNNNQLHENQNNTVLPKTAEALANLNLKLVKGKTKRRIDVADAFNKDNKSDKSHVKLPQTLSKPENQKQQLNTKLNDFFPVRRSVRKTKKMVQEEHMRIIEKAIREEREDGLQVQEFDGKGRGVIAVRDFTKGEFVVEYIGDLITINEANKREQIYAEDQNTGCYMYYFKHKNLQYCIDATPETGKLGRLVNHSRNGNLMTKTVVYQNRPHLILLAKEDIKSGEELTYDYGDRSKESLMHHPWLAL